MQIGGEDYQVNVKTTPDLKRFIRGYCENIWPHLVVEKLPGEWFLYPNKAAKASWTSEGLTPENSDQMFHVIFEEEYVGFVVSELANSKTRKMALELTNNIEVNWPRFELTSPRT